LSAANPSSVSHKTFIPCNEKEVLYKVILSLEAPNKFGKCIPEFGEMHSSVLGCEKRPL